MGADRREEENTSFNPRLLDWLVCPITRGLLAWDRDDGELVSKAAGLAYPIRNGIPIMLASEARAITCE
ncbi:Trm112 family protein [Mesorhizobium sp. dw_380]|uniref:Trm112 family protein n=1 Tax=Mesorhizobium sp. dw_380 TaxID=2812001 RepID=UPI001BDEB668|nr:Trm112 family protein [Mesorhizobium sp. dw_380]